MLPPFIIEQIRKREEEETRRDREHQPVVELPLPPPSRRPRREADEEADRGVVIIDL